MSMRLITVFASFLFIPLAYAGEPLQHTLQCYVRIVDKSDYVSSNPDKMMGIGPKLFIAVQFSEPPADRKTSPNFRIFDPNDILMGRSGDVFLKYSDHLGFITKNLSGDVFTVIVYAKELSSDENSKIGIAHYKKDDVFNLYDGLCMPIDSNSDPDVVLEKFKLLPNSMTKVTDSPE